MLKGTLAIDGSSTVYPLTAAIAEEFRNENKDVKITVSESGTGTGMSRLCEGEIKIADASRVITMQEKAECSKSGVTYTEWKVALDGITVVVNKDNTWVKQLSVAQLKAIFEQDSKVKRWSDIPGTTGFPNALIRLYTPGSASGTFEFFTEHINQTKKVQRLDQVTQSEDDNVLVKGVAGDTYAIGYFGYGYYKENKSKVKAIAISDTKRAIQPIVPTMKSIQDGSYTLSRPLYIYVNQQDMEKNEVVKAFVEFYKKNAETLAKEVQMIPVGGQT
jgi:phosphate transport system substrate-binding protein